MATVLVIGVTVLVTLPLAGKALSLFVLSEFWAAERIGYLSTLFQSGGSTPRRCLTKKSLLLRSP